MTPVSLRLELFTIKRLIDPRLIGLEVLGQFRFRFPPSMSHTPISMPDGTVLRQCGSLIARGTGALQTLLTIVSTVRSDRFEVRVYCGEMEMRAAVYDLEGKVSDSVARAPTELLTCETPTQMLGESTFLEE